MEHRWDRRSDDADVKITRAHQQLRMQVTYEVTRPVLGNAGVCIRFDDTIEVDLR